MTDFDLDRLGDVWRQQPDPAEMERLQKSAAAVAKRARLAQVIDIGAALAVSAVVIVLVASNPKLNTILIGAAAILVLLSSTVRLRKLRRVELETLSGSTEHMLDQSINRVETQLRYRRYSHIAIGPGFVAGMLLAIFAQGRGIVPTLQSWPLSFVPLVIAVVAVATAFSFRALGRSKTELERLKAMREAYRSERESTGS